VKFNLEVVFLFARVVLVVSLRVAVTTFSLLFGIPPPPLFSWFTHLGGLATK
jgi:hypothetical protein